VADPNFIPTFRVDRDSGFIAFLPLVPVRLKYLKPKVVLPAPTTLGEHIKKRRLDLKLTVKEAGKLLGSDESSIINWEKGRTVPKVYRLPAMERGWSRKLASRHLGVDVSTLRDWEHGKVILFRTHRRLVAKVLGIPESELDGEMKARWRNAHGQA
jgi:transcriptional regulator with XRE-family HTH domain